jgi:hypothetical protein
MKKLKIALIIIAAIIITIQFIPVNRTNPPVTAGLDARMEVISVFKKSCYDCHSNYGPGIQTLLQYHGLLQAM